MRLEFWKELLPALQRAGYEHWAGITATTDSWLSSAIGAGGCSINLCFLRHEIRVELVFNRSDRSENKELFDQLSENRDRYEKAVGEALEWRRNDDKKVSMVVCKNSVQGYSKENWPGMVTWLVDHYRKMDDTFSEPVRALASRMRPGGGA